MIRHRWPGKKWPSDCLTTAVLLAAGLAAAVRAAARARRALAAEPDARLFAASRRVLAALILAAGLGAALLPAFWLAGASGALAPAQPAVFSSRELVSQASTPLCANGNGAAGDPVYGKACTGAASQIWSATWQDVCNGGHAVIPTCPFKPGLDLNRVYQGQDIISIPGGAEPGLTWGSTTPNWFILQKTPGQTGELYVQSGQCTVAGGGCQLVSVGASDNLNTPDHYEAVCSEGTNLTLQTENTPAESTGRCKWHSQTP